ncbi:MAG TPA: alpha/beta hydrolase [Ktedonobacterales bacterium]|nr:alpha/beta hydrolase [Ktedonobacterales bacterium]
MRTVTSKDGARIAFDQSGQGPAVILVSGATATRADEASLAAALAPSFTVFAYDRRGRGDSGDMAPYAVEREVEDIEALIDEAGGAAFVFGHSSGAVLALEAARLLPRKITKLALYEPPIIIDDSHPHVPLDYVARLNELVATGHRGEAVETFMAFVSAPADISEMIAQMRQSPMWPHLEALAHTLAYDGAIVQDTERGDPAALRKWETTAVPTLVIDGEVFMGQAEPHAFMRHGADELARVLPNARRLTLEGQDHGPVDEVLVPALKAFFLG